MLPGWPVLRALTAAAVALVLMSCAVREGEPQDSASVPETAASPATSAPGALPPTVAPLPSPSPAALLASPLPLRPGSLAANTANLSFVPFSGIAVTAPEIEVRCNRSGDSLGVLGSSRDGPLTARVQLSIAPFHGDGSYRDTATSGEIGGSISLTGSLHLFLGPPHQSTATVTENGRLGHLAFTGPNVDGRAVSGSLRWDCDAITELR